MGAAAITINFRNDPSNSTQGFSLIEVLLSLLCVSSLALLLGRLYMQMELFAKKREQCNDISQKQLMIQEWLANATEQAGFLGCQSNNKTFRHTQTEATQYFLSQHPAVRGLPEVLTVLGLSQSRHSNNTSKKSLAQLTKQPLKQCYYKNELKKNKYKILEVQYLAVKPWLIQLIRPHVFEVSITHSYHPGAVVAMADCKVFKIVHPIQNSNFSKSTVKWKVHDQIPYLDPKYTVIGEWRQDSYYLDSMGALYKKEDPGITKLLLA